MPTTSMRHPRRKQQLNLIKLLRWMKREKSWQRDLKDSYLDPRSKSYRVN